MIIGWVFSCPVVFPDQRVYLDKAQQLISGFLVEHSSVHIIEIIPLLGFVKPLTLFLLVDNTFSACTLYSECTTIYYLQIIFIFFYLYICSSCYTMTAFVSVSDHAHKRAGSNNKVITSLFLALTPILTRITTYQQSLK